MKIFNEQMILETVLKDYFETNKNADQKGEAYVITVQTKDRFGNTDYVVFVIKNTTTLYGYGFFDVKEKKLTLHNPLGYVIKRFKNLIFQSQSVRVS